MVGANAPRMLAITLPHVDAWNTWFTPYGNTAEGFAEHNAELTAAAERAGRDPAQIERSACVLVEERRRRRAPARRRRPCRLADARAHLARARAGRRGRGDPRARPDRRRHDPRRGAYALAVAIEKIPFGSTGHESTRTIFGAAALSFVTQAEADDGARAPARARRQPHRHRRELRRRRAAHRALARRAPRRLLPRDEDRGARARRRPRRDPPLARAAGRRLGRPDPAAQPRRPRRVGDRDGPGRCARGGGRGARRRARALHRRHRPRCSTSPSATCRASRSSRSTPCCFRTTTSSSQDDALRRRRRGAARALRGSWGRGADDQEPLEGALAHRGAHGCAVVRAVDRARARSTRPSRGRSARRASS